MGEITFNDISVVLDRINKNTTALISAVVNMRDELNELKAAADATKAKVVSHKSYRPRPLVKSSRFTLKTQTLKRLAHE